MKSKKSKKSKKKKLPELAHGASTCFFGESACLPAGRESPEAEKRDIHQVPPGRDGFLWSGIRLDMFQEVEFKPKSTESAVLIIVCAAVFGLAFFAGGHIMGGYNEKVAGMLRGGSALAAENQKNKNISSVEKNIPLEGEKFSETMSGAADAAKNLVIRAKVARARKIAQQQRAAEIALINSAPVLAGPTTGLPDGKRVCPLSHPHPSGRGGKSHIDEDCCADYDEYPNPRCAYSPSQMAALKKP